jgi:FkbM family methyltransferase
VTFHLDNPEDSVQRVLTKGRLFEADLLTSHSDLIFHGSTVVDVGANIGNHTVYYALTRAKRVYPLEPNPVARALLERTVETNRLEAVDLSYVRLGAGARPERRSLHTPNPNNLGKTVLTEDAGPDQVAVQPLDDLHFRGRVSFIKIDVEGMELDVLRGAAATISENRPGLGVEVDDRNADAFWRWLEENAYHVTRVVRYYAANANYVCVPRGRAGPVAR